MQNTVEASTLVRGEHIQVLGTNSVCRVINTGGVYIELLNEQNETSFINPKSFVSLIREQKPQALTAKSLSHQDLADRYNSDRSGLTTHKTCFADIVGEGARSKLMVKKAQ